MLLPKGNSTHNGIPWALLSVSFSPMSPSSLVQLPTNHPDGEKGGTTARWGAWTDTEQGLGSAHLSRYLQGQRKHFSSTGKEPN